MTNLPIACLSLLCALAAAPAHANDSMAQTALGGLVLTRSDAISMDSEDLYISRDHVRVRYRFTNRSDRPIDALVAFPLPDIPPATAAERKYWGDPASTLKFVTRVDGRRLNLAISESAILHGRNISARLAALHVPLNRLAGKFDTAINRLPAGERKRLIAGGLIRSDGVGNQPIWAGLWSLRTTATRRQAFPARRTIIVEHDYVPITGGSVSGLLDPHYRSEPDTADYFAHARRKYCLDEDWLRSFDRALARRPADTMLPYSEIWLGYVLSTGANWKGPIGNFRLVIDKGKPDSLMSLCARGMKKISPTQFEMRRLNFTPASDLDILIIDWGDR